MDSDLCEQVAKHDTALNDEREKCEKLRKAMDELRAEGLSQTQAHKTALSEALDAQATVKAQLREREQSFAAAKSEADTEMQLTRKVAQRAHGLEQQLSEAQTRVHTLQQALARAETNAHAAVVQAQDQAKRDREPLAGLCSDQARRLKRRRRNPGLCSEG